MKILDEKGRLFGKINIIDFLVMVFLLCIFPAFYFGYKIANQKAIVPPKTFTELELGCKFIKLIPSLAEMISAGDKELDENGNTTAEIIELGKIEPYVYEFDIGGGRKIKEISSDYVQCLATLRLRVEVRDNGFFYENGLVRVGDSFNFDTKRYSIKAVYEDAKEERGSVDIYLNVILKDLDPDTAEKISAGDKEVDDQGNTIAEILGVGRLEDNSLLFNLEGDSFIQGVSKGKKQVSVKMKLNCMVNNLDQLYFKNQRLLSKIPFEFHTDEYNVSGFVILNKANWLRLKVKFSGVIPEVANAVRKGDIEKDKFNNEVARITSIISSKRSEVLALRESEFITVNHPFNNDIVVSLDVLCIEKDGAYYFDNFPVKMGNMINFMTDLYSLSGTIVGVEIQ